MESAAGAGRSVLTGTCRPIVSCRRPWNGLLLTGELPASTVSDDELRRSRLHRPEAPRGPRGTERPQQLVAVSSGPRPPVGTGLTTAVLTATAISVAVIALLFTLSPTPWAADPAPRRPVPLMPITASTVDNNRIEAGDPQEPIRFNRAINAICSGISDRGPLSPPAVIFVQRGRMMRHGFSAP
jgi:hypothetical protein